MDIGFGEELIIRTQHDQTMRRNSLEDDTAWDPEVDASNTEFLKKYIAKNGWPKLSDLGLEGSTAAWLLVQHADHDIDFQTNCLELMKALPKEEVDQTRIAFLEDRILTSQSKPQLYGTQFKIGKNFGPLAINDIANLDMRRAEMGLSSFKEYEDTMFQQYGHIR